MSTDAKNAAVIIGAILGTGAAMTAVLVTPLRGPLTSIEGRIANVGNGLRRTTRTALGDEIRATRTELRDEIRALDSRARTVENASARVDRRLETVEGAVIPAAEAPQQPYTNP